MSDAASTSAAPAAVTQPPAAVTEPTEAKQVQETTEVKKTDGEMEESTVPKEDVETAGPQATTEVTAPDGQGTTEVAEPPSGAVDGASTPASDKKGKRKSISGVPEHKSKKQAAKKVQPTLRLDCKPGEMYWARLKGFPPWPAIICDEQLLPEALLGTRPVSTSRPDGSIRDDFKEGGKNAKERTFPIMFLATNEFSWMVNTSLTPLDPEETKTMPSGKMSKMLKQAYELAGENHDLEYYRRIFQQFEEEEQRILAELAKKDEENAKKAAAKAAKEAEAADAEKPKKKSRKSKGGSEDVDMEDADAPKSSKKRKKDAESDADGAKPAKTPKLKKLNAPKTPNGEAAQSAKKPSSKPRKKVSAPKEEEKEDEPEMTEEERFKQREKAILFLRHKLQKGFLSRDKAPAEDEMETMGSFFGQLEGYEDLQPAIIRSTKIHKVLKAIVKLATIPKEEHYHFKDRSHALLNVWNKSMEADGEGAKSAVEPKSAVSEATPVSKANGAEKLTNGEKKEDDKEADKAEEEANAKKPESKIEEKVDEAAEKVEEKIEAAEEKKPEPEPALEAPTEPAVAKEDKPTPAGVTSGPVQDGEGDVSMQTAPESAEAS